MTDYVEVRRDFLDWTPVYRGGVIAMKKDASDGSSTPGTGGDRHEQTDLVREVQPGDSMSMRTPMGLETISEKPAHEEPS